MPCTCNDACTEINNGMGSTLHNTYPMNISIVILCTPLEYDNEH